MGTLCYSEIKVITDCSDENGFSIDIKAAWIATKNVYLLFWRPLRERSEMANTLLSCLLLDIEEKVLLSTTYKLYKYRYRLSLTIFAWEGRLCSQTKSEALLGQNYTSSKLHYGSRIYWYLRKRICPRDFN